MATKVLNLFGIAALAALLAGFSAPAVSAQAIIDPEVTDPEVTTDPAVDEDPAKEEQPTDETVYDEGDGPIYYFGGHDMTDGDVEAWIAYSGMVQRGGEAGASRGGAEGDAYCIVAKNAMKTSVCP